MELETAEKIVEQLKVKLSGYYTTVIPNGNPYGVALEALLTEYYRLKEGEK